MLRAPLLSRGPEVTPSRVSAAAGYPRAGAARAFDNLSQRSIAPLARTAGYPRVGAARAFDNLSQRSVAPLARTAEYPRAGAARDFDTLSAQTGGPAQTIDLPLLRRYPATRQRSQPAGTRPATPGASPYRQSAAAPGQVVSRLASPPPASPPPLTSTSPALSDARPLNAAVQRMSGVAHGWMTGRSAPVSAEPAAAGQRAASRADVADPLPLVQRLSDNRAAGRAAGEIWPAEPPASRSIQRLGADSGSVSRPQLSDQPLARGQSGRRSGDSPVAQRGPAATGQSAALIFAAGQRQLAPAQLAGPLLQRLSAPGIIRWSAPLPAAPTSSGTVPSRRAEGFDRPAPSAALPWLNSAWGLRQSTAAQSPLQRQLAERRVEQRTSFRWPHAGAVESASLPTARQFARPTAAASDSPPVQAQAGSALPTIQPLRSSWLATNDPGPGIPRVTLATIQPLRSSWLAANDPGPEIPRVTLATIQPLRSSWPAANDPALSRVAPDQPIDRSRAADPAPRLFAGQTPVSLAVQRIMSNNINPTARPTSRPTTQPFDRPPLIRPLTIAGGQIRAGQPLQRRTENADRPAASLQRQAEGGARESGWPWIARSAASDLERSSGAQPSGSGALLPPLALVQRSPVPDHPATFSSEAGRSEQTGRDRQSSRLALAQPLPFNRLLRATLAQATQRSADTQPAARQQRAPAATLASTLLMRFPQFATSAAAQPADQPGAGEQAESLALVRPLATPAASPATPWSDSAESGPRPSVLAQRAADTSLDWVQPARPAQASQTSLQRVIGAESAPDQAGGGADGSASQPEGMDIEALARQVYSRLRRRLRIDAERLGR
jgi:hypothetical protein